MHSYQNTLSRSFTLAALSAALLLPLSGRGAEANPPAALPGGLQVNGGGAADTSATTRRSWNFQVTLNDSPIGNHQFNLQRQGDEARLVGQANFDVKILFVNAYRYRHQVTETWRGDCLNTLEANTDDDGKASVVSARSEQDKLLVVSPQGKTSLPGCVMSFAYWNPAFLKQTRLLNSQTGRYQDVTITPLGNDKQAIGDTTVQARHYRLTGTDQPIELWYSADGNWLGLQTTVGGDKILRYRLR